MEVSFCATNLDTQSTLAESLASVERLADRCPRPFEILVADGPSGPDAERILEEWATRSPTHRVLHHGQRNRGYGRRLAFEASHGRYVVPFDTSIVYSELLGELLARYLALKTDRMLFSELCALSRASVQQVGGWRDLIGGEDVDLYAPVAERFGLLAYPTGDLQSQSRVLSSVSRQLRYARGSRAHRGFRLLLTQRDQIIGANYRVGDLMAFNRTKPFGTRLAARGWFTLAGVAAAVSPLRRRAVDATNNYLYLRERTISSMLRRDYLELDWKEGPRPRLPLTRDEMTYLTAKSETWRSAYRANPECFPEKA